MDIFGGEVWLRQLLEKDESRLFPLARARALCARTALLILMVEPEQASACAAEGLKIYETLGDPIGEIDGLLSVSLATGSGDHLKKALEKAKTLGDKGRQATAYEGLAWGGGKRENRRWYLEKALSLLRDSGNLIQMAGMLIDLAAIDYSEGQYELALKEFEEFIKNDRNLKAEYFKTNDLRTVFARATIAIIKGDYEQSRLGYEECAEVIKKVGDRYNSNWLYARAGHAAVLQGDFLTARSIFTEVTCGFKNISSENGLAFTLEGAANLCARIGKYKQAAHLIGWADAARKRVGDTRPHGEQADIDRIISACLLKIGEEFFSDAYDAGQKMTMDEVVQYALEES
jgi:tetratricopeptide (TPR) repeat protein